MTRRAHKTHLKTRAVNAKDEIGKILNNVKKKKLYHRQTQYILLPHEIEIMEKALKDLDLFFIRLPRKTLLEVLEELQ